VADPDEFRPEGAWPDGRDCLRAAELVALANAVTPSLAGWLPGALDVQATPG
jgi:hypothetical protein